ncbi:MAG: DUF58 domain-containing protein [Planctomycetes bacterium]|nr:DUF58 domain-containing protein [Planctomycetota bacterium]
MSKSRLTRTTKGTAVSLAGILALLSGAVFLYAYWKFPALARHRSVSWQFLFVTAAVVMVTWGLYDVVRSFLAASSRGDTRRDVAREKTEPPLNQRALVSWWGVVLVFMGTQLAYSVFSRTTSRMIVILGVGAGLLLVLGGIREIIRTILPSGHKDKPRRRVALPLQGGVYLVVMFVMFVAALTGRSNMLLLVFSLMAGPFVANGWMTLTTLKRIRVRREVPERMMAGDRITVQLVIENDKRRLSSWLMDVADRIRGQGEELTTGVMFTRVPPRGQCRGRYELRLMQRGRYIFGPISASTRFPLGFVERGLDFPQTDEILVYPRLGRLLPAFEQVQSTDSELAHRQQPQVSVYDDEFHRLRSFRWGDNPRAIHWRTSARRNELMVREYQQTWERDLTILLDLRRPKNAADADWERVELAVSFAATVAVEQMRNSRDSRILLVTSGMTGTHWQGRAGPAGFESLLEYLALIQPGTSSAANSFDKLADLHPSTGARTILITTGDADHLAQRPVGLAEDPQVFTASSSGLSRYFELTPFSSSVDSAKRSLSCVL